MLYLNYYNQRNIILGKDFYTLKDLSNEWSGGVPVRNRIITDFFQKSAAGQGETQTGKIEYNGTNVLYTNTSDIRVKENLKPIENNFDISDELNPCNFEFRTSNLSSVDVFIADEVYEIYPCCCSGTPGAIFEDGTPGLMMIDTKPLISILAKCIKGNRQEIKDFKQKKQTYD